MRYSKDRKASTRQRIIESASQRFTANGYAATSIDDVMRDCGLTRGGFYAHFKSKSELYREAIGCAAARTKDDSTNSSVEPILDSLFEECLDGKAASRGRAQWAFFATDVGSDDLDVRTAYTHALKTMSEKIRAHAVDGIDRDDAILSMTAMIVGAMAIAQTTDDEVLKRRLVASCKIKARALLQSELHPAPTFFWAA